MATIQQPLLAHQIVSANDLKGMRVRSFGGEDLAKVDDFAIDFRTGRVVYVIVSTGGFLGVGENLRAIPWRLLSTRPEQPDLFVDIDKEMLEKAPSFEKGKWPDMENPKWAAEINSYYSRKPSWSSDFTQTGDYAGDDRIDKPDRDRI
jgi:sporulation protein YlmC with PRC-barrel domain